MKTVFVTLMLCVLVGCGGNGQITPNKAYALARVSLTNAERGEKVLEGLNAISHEQGYAFGTAAAKCSAALDAANAARDVGDDKGFESWLTIAEAILVDLTKSQDAAKSQFAKESKP